MDLVVCNNNEPALIYRNNANELLHHHYIKLRLTGEGMNTKAYGAKIEIITPDSLTQYQELYPVRGYQSTVTQDDFIWYVRQFNYSANKNYMAR